MFTVIAIMSLGILFGYLIRHKNIRGIISGATTALIWLLLFVLGIEVGHNRQVIESLGTLGLEALFIAIISLIGSCIAAWILWKYIAKRREQ
ncbi:MAG: LysO family transporter [Bacteroidaceae bacterium]|nr:LysO family transporter [Bacteroidaceae bacterium]